MRDLGLDFSYVWYSFKTEKENHKDNLWGEKRRSNKSNHSGGLQKGKVNKSGVARAGMVDYVSGTDALMGSTQKHLKERTRDALCRNCTLRETLCVVC